MGVNEPVFEEDQARVNAAGLIKAIQRVAQSLIDPHRTDIRTCPKRSFQSCDGIVRVGIGTTGTSVHLHDAQFHPTKCPGQFGSAIEGHLLAGDWINPNLAAKEQLILIAHIEIEDPCVFEEELTFLWNEDFERCQIERLKVDLSISKISVSRQIQDEDRKS